MMNADDQLALFYAVSGVIIAVVVGGVLLFVGPILGAVFWRRRDAELKRELRIVLLGKTGAGKSATGNTILGKEALKSTTCASSVTKECQKETRVFDGQIVDVVDTPGLYDTTLSKADVIAELGKCISFSAPGPHVFMVVIQPIRFTEEEQKTVKLIQKIFGEAAARYTMVLFTHGDELKTDGVAIEKFIRDSQPLYDFISQCGGRYHVFNNRDKNPSQIRELLTKISLMIQINGGSCYTNEMFRAAEKAIEEEEKKLLKKNTNMKPEEARTRAERDNSFIQEVEIYSRSGTAAGHVVGRHGAVVGAVLGAALGGVVERWRVKMRECVIQ